MSDNFALLADAFLDGTLDEEQAARLLTWLETSPGAIAHLRALAGIDQGLRRLAGTPADGAATRRAVLARVRASGGSQRMRLAVERQLHAGPRPRRWSQRLRRGRTWSFTAAAAVMLVIITLALTWSRPEPVPLVPGALAVVEATTGWVTIERDEQNVSVQSGHALVAGDWLVTGEDAEATLRLTDGSRLVLKAGGRLRLPAPEGARARLERGTVVASVTPQAPNAAPILSTPETAIRVLGTEFTLSAGVHLTIVRVSGGVVAVRTGDDHDWVVHVGEELRLVDGRLEKTTALPMRRRPGDPWHQGNARTLAGMPSLRGGEGTASGSTTPLPALSAWGGLNDRQVPNNGHFALHHDGRRWWAVDPAGHLAVLAGIGNMRHALGENDPALLAHFGTYAGWLDTACDVLADSDGSLIGSSSDHTNLGAVQQQRGRPTAVILSYDVSRDFAKGYLLQHPTLADTRPIVDALAPLLPGYAAHVAVWEKRLALAVMPAVAGVITDRSIPMTFSWGDLRQAAGRDHALAKALTDWLAARQHGLMTADAADLAALQRRCLEGYRDQVFAAARRAAPQTPLFGQMVGLTPASEDVRRILGTSVDAVAVSCIGHWLEDPGVLVRASQQYGRPLFIESIYAKGADSGLPNRDGNGLEVPTQADRARYYQHFALLMLESRVVIGWQWYRYEDVGEGPFHSLADYDSNKGLIDPQFRPHRTLIEGMRDLNRLRYAIIDYFDQR